MFTRSNSPPYDKPTDDKKLITARTPNLIRVSQ